MEKGISFYFYILKNQCLPLSKIFYVKQNRGLFPIILVIENFQFPWGMGFLGYNEVTMTFGRPLPPSESSEFDILK